MMAGMNNRRYLLLYGGPIGDSLVAIHVGRTLAANVSGAKLELLSTRENGFVRDLCQKLPFILYRSLPKESLWSWTALIGLAISRNTLIVYEPISTNFSQWWRLILWCARLRPGNIELRVQTEGYERTVPRGVLSCVYDCVSTSFFDTPKLILETWGLPTTQLPSPNLPRKVSHIGGSYIVFCFFAGGTSRSISPINARAILEGARAAYPKHQCIVVCSSEERKEAESVVKGVADTKIESGRSAQEIIALLSGAGLVVGTTSGIVLMAAHLNCPLVALHCMSHAKAFMPDFSPSSIVIAALSECRCLPGDGSACKMMTGEGVRYRCLYFITTKEILSAMAIKLPIK